MGSKFSAKYTRNEPLIPSFPAGGRASCAVMASRVFVRGGIGQLGAHRRIAPVDLVVCPACSIAWGCKSPVQPDGGEGLAKHKGVIRGVAPRWRLKEVRSKAA